MNNIKRFVRKHKREVTIAAIALVALLFIIILYKSLFYSKSEKSVYGVRLNGISEHKLKDSTLEGWESSIKDMKDVSDCKVTLKGRLLKFFVTFESNVSTDDIKTKFNDIVKDIDADTKSYYDIELYAKQSKDGDMKYPVIGYKHKSKDSVSYDTF